MDYSKVKCPFCKLLLEGSVAFGFQCSKCLARDGTDGWSKYVVVIYEGNNVIQKITLNDHYIIDDSEEEFTQLNTLEGCILTGKQLIPKLRIDLSLGEEKIHQVLKTFLVFS